MKSKLLFLILIFSFLMPQQKANAGIFDSDYFEPTLFCAVAGGAAYASMADDSNQMLMTGIGCATGALIGYWINSRYKKKYGTVYQEEIRDLRRAVREMEVIQAQKAANGEEDQFSIRIQEIVPGKRLPNGDVLAPTIREKLVLPGEGVRIGE